MTNVHTRLRSRTGEAEMIASTVDELTNQYNHDYWRECVAAERRPTELWAELGDLGFLGIPVPEAYGGEGLGIREQAALVETLAANAVTLPFLVPSSWMAPIPIAAHGNEEFKERFLPRIALGETRFCLAHYGTGGRHHLFNIRTSADPEGDKYVIDGRNTYISGLESAD